MTVPLHFEYPGVWIEIDLEHDEGSVVAAQSALGRSVEPVPRETAADLEARFGALADLMRRAEVQMGFALVPDPPLLGLVGWLTVRWYPAPGDDPIGDLVGDTVPEGSTLLDEPFVRHEETALGAATVALHRYSAAAPERTRSFGRGKSSAPVVEHIRWAWVVEDPAGPPLVVTVMSTTDRLRFAPELREHVAAFARGIRVGS